MLQTWQDSLQCFADLFFTLSQRAFGLCKTQEELMRRKWKWKMELALCLVLFTIFAIHAQWVLLQEYKNPFVKPYFVFSTLCYGKMNIIILMIYLFFIAGKSSVHQTVVSAAHVSAPPPVAHGGPERQNKYACTMNPRERSLSERRYRINNVLLSRRVIPFYYPGSFTIP